jgi:hypothetical protein
VALEQEVGAVVVVGVGPLLVREDEVGGRLGFCAWL